MLRPLGVSVPSNKIDQRLRCEVWVLEAYANAWKLFNEPLQDGLELHLTNGLWVKADYPLNSEFIKAITESFKGSLEPVNTPH